MQPHSPQTSSQAPPQTDELVAEAGAPAENLVAYRRCLSQFATGVTVVTARVGERLVGMTANSFSSVSLTPPLVLWSIKRSSQSFPIFSQAAHFAVNILAKDQIELSLHFGQSGEDKFSTVDWESGLAGAPLLQGAVASFECRRIESFEGGDHLIMLGEVERFVRRRKDVLLFVQGKYAVSADHPDAKLPKLPGAAAAAHPSGPSNESLSGLMYRAYGALAAILERERQVEGISAIQSRVLAAIATFPARDLDGLMPELYLSKSVAEDAIAELAADGLAQEDERGLLHVTSKGRARLARLLARVRAKEAETLSGLADEEVLAARRLLVKLIEFGRTALDN